MCHSLRNLQLSSPKGLGYGAPVAGNDPAAGLQKEVLLRLHLTGLLENQGPFSRGCLGEKSHLHAIGENKKKKHGIAIQLRLLTGSARSKLPLAQTKDVSNNDTNITNI